MKLYIYDHCPYCVKARMIFGLTGMPITLVYLLNDDEATPTRLIGKKMVPILEFTHGKTMPESMDIVREIDRLSGRPVLAGQGGNATLAAWLEDLSAIRNPLCMPRWVKAPLPEYASEMARRYFIRAKEGYIGPFAEHLANSPALMAQANAMLVKLAPMIHLAEAVHGELSEDDFHLFAALRSLSIVKGLEYPAKVEAYRQKMSKLSGVPLHDEIAL